MREVNKSSLSLTAFRRRAGEVLREVEKSGRPVVVTVRGRVAAVVQSVEEYRRLMDVAAQADAREGIRQGVEDLRAGRVRPAEEFFSEFEQRHGIRRLPE